MAGKTTEAVHPEAEGLDSRALEDVAELLASAQVAAAEAVLHSLEAICGGARAMAATLQSGSRLHYVGAGSSGLMAASDAQELGSTFSIPHTQVRVHMAGGLPTGSLMPGETEDETDTLAARLSELSATDTMIAVAASGTTPYTVAAAEIAKGLGATVIGIANNPDTELLRLADHKVRLATPPEVLSGSTRLGAATAQKIALNMMSTLMGIELGHVHDGMMINLRADNTKLRERASGIVARIARTSVDEAAKYLDAAEGEVKCAILLAAGSASHSEAKSLLEKTSGQLRPALQSLG